MKLEALREIPGILKTSPEKNLLRSPLIQGGIPRGAISEIQSSTGNGRTQVFLSLLQENPHLRAAWIERELTFHPPHLPEQGLSLDHLFFIETGPHFFWSIQEVLRSKLFDIIALEASDSFFSENELRRIQILAHQGDASILLLRNQPLRAGHWMLRRRFEVKERSA